MEILFVSHKFPPAIGGMEKQSFELINGMKRFATVHQIVYTGQQSKLWFFLSLEKKIQKLCRQFPSITVIHFNDALVAAFCVRHKHYSHIRRVVTVHGLDIVFPSSIYQKYILPAFNHFDLIIAVSQATRTACIERGIDEHKIVVINNGVSHTPVDKKQVIDFYERFAVKYGIDLHGKTILTALGRPVKRKGFSWFIQNVLPFLEGNFIFLIAGPFNKARSWQDRIFHILPGVLRKKIELFLGYPTDENKIRELLTQKKFSANVCHLGKLHHAELTQLLLATDAFIMPNIPVRGDMEGFGLVCLEASLCGSWVFASKTEGITDAVQDHKNGTLLLSQNSSAWITALNVFLGSPANFDRQRQLALTYTRAKFGWDKMVSGYRDQFSRLEGN